jgi:hypothetical protein
MSEYQYYEFQAIDRPLTRREMGELRSYSSRATISATRFVNSYSYGNFKGSPSQWMDKYFDAFLYLANWGTHELMLRFPLRVLDLATAKRYCRGESASGRAKGDHVVLELRSEDEGGEWVEEDNGQLSSLISLRADVAGGDLRALYLAWLLCVQAGELDEAEEEPPCPPGLGTLTAPLEALVDFLRVDRDLIEVAAARSPDATSAASATEIERWVAELPESERTGLLVRLMDGTEAHLRAELLRRFRDSRGVASRASADGARTAGELLGATRQRAEERRRKEAEQAERERARREREAAAARDRNLDSLAKREVQAWDKIRALVATKQPGRYDEAVQLLRDLRDLGLRKGRAAEVAVRVRQLCVEHARKPSFIERLRKAGLAAEVQP